MYHNEIISDCAFRDFFDSTPNYYSQVVSLSQYDMDSSDNLSFPVIGDGGFDQNWADIKMS